MRFIAHRGNTEGPKPELENDPRYVISSIKNGFDCEIDVWRVNDQYYLGHDEPQYLIDFKFLVDHHKNLWCHAKNLEALWDLVHIGQLNCFWHQNDDYTVTSHGYVWTFPGKEVKQYGSRQIILLPTWIIDDDLVIPNGGICSDYISLYKLKYR